MAGIKIVNLPAVGRDLISTDLFELSLAGGSGSRKITGQEIMNASKLNVGGTPIINGTVGRILFQGASDTLGESANLFWDNTNGRLGIKTTSPQSALGFGASQHITFSNGTGFNGYVGEFAINNVLSIGTSSGYPIAFRPDNIERARFATATGNFLINTTTDAGFKLDVNGTARVQGNITMTSGTALTVGSIQIFDDTSGIRVIQALSNQGLLIRANSNTITLNNSAGSGNAVFSTTGSYRFSPNSLGTGGIVFSGASGPPNNTAITFVRARNDGAKSGIINTEDFAASGFPAIDLFLYAGKETVSNTQANLILAHDGTISRGNVGIGTSSPTYKLDVLGTTRFKDAGSNSSVLIDYATGAYIRMNDASLAEAIRLRAGGGASWFNTGQNFLIGTTTDAGYKLDVNGTARVQGVFSALNASSEGIRLRNDQGSYPAIEFWQAVVRASITRETNSGLTFDAGGYAMHTSGGGTLIGGVNRFDLSASAQLQVQSTTKGFLPPRMTNAQRTAIASPAVGLIVYCTDATEGLWIYKSSGWTFIV